MIAVQVKALIVGKLHDGLEYMAKLMPMNEYRASWLHEVSKRSLAIKILIFTIKIKSKYFENFRFASKMLYFYDVLLT